MGDKTAVTARLRAGSLAASGNLPSIAASRRLQFASAGRAAQQPPYRVGFGTWALAVQLRLKPLGAHKVCINRTTGEIASSLVFDLYAPKRRFANGRFDVYRSTGTENAVVEIDAPDHLYAALLRRSRDILR